MLREKKSLLHKCTGIFQNPAFPSILRFPNCLLNNEDHMLTLKAKIGFPNILKKYTCTCQLGLKLCCCHCSDVFH